MSWGPAFFSLFECHARPSCLAFRSLNVAVVLFLLCCTGCVQDSPPSSKERTLSLLLELLHDAEPEVRRTAAESLGKIGDPQALDALLPLIHDPASVVRQAGVTALGRLKPAATNDVMVLFTLALQDPVLSVRQAAVVAIGEVGPAPRLQEQVLLLLRSSDAMVRRSAVAALLQIDSSQSIPLLIETGLDADAEVRQGIAAALGEWGGAEAAPWLRARLAQDPSPAVRAEAAYRLSILNDPDTKAALHDATASDPDSGVRDWAKRGA